MPTNPTIQQDTAGRNVAGVQPAGQQQQVALKGGSVYTDANTGIQSAPQVTQLQDATTTNQATITPLHNTDNQAFGSNINGLLTGGVAQMVNTLGNLDRQRETGQDGVAAIGITTGGAQFAMAFATTDSTDNFAAGTRTFTPALMKGTLQGVAWSIQVGSVLTLDTGGSAEVVTVTAVTSTTFTCLTVNAHNGTGTPFPITGFVYNQERDAAGELDGASGAGTAVAVEYEYNGGGPGAMNYDRERNVQGKGVATATISAGGGAGSSSFTTSAAPTGLQPGQPIYVTGGTAETVYVAKNYVVGSSTVPLASATVNGSHTGFTYDIYALPGAAANGMTPYGIGAEVFASYDKNAAAGQPYYLAQSILGAFLVQQGGQQTGTIAAAAAGAIKASRGICCTVLVTATGTAAVNLYDNPSAASGTVICAIPANAATGTIYQLNMPCATGIYVGGAANTPALTVAFV